MPDPFTRYAPSAVATGPQGRRRIDVVYAAQSHLWHLVYQEPGGWAPHWRKRGGAYKSSVSICAFSGGRVDTFGLGMDGNVYHAWGLGDQLDGAGEWPTENLGHPPDRTIVSGPAAMATGPTGLVAAVRTVRDSDHAPGIWFVMLETTGLPGGATWAWHRYLTGDWPTVQHEAATGLGLTWRKPGLYDLAVVGSDTLLRHTLSDGSWEVFNQTGEGTLTSTPDLTYWHEPADPCVHIAVCYGPTPLLPGAVAVKSWLGKHWTKQNLIYINGTTERRGVQGPPCITSWGEPRLDVFFLTAADIAGSDLALTHMWRNSPDPWGLERLPSPPLT